MLGNYDFNLALDILHRVTTPVIGSTFQGNFSQEYADLNPITTALKIIHKTSQEGTSAQRNQLSQFRHEIIGLNALLSQNQIAQRVQQSLNIEIEDEAAKLKDMQIAVPQTSFEKMVEIASLIPRIFFSQQSSISR